MAGTQTDDPTATDPTVLPDPTTKRTMINAVKMRDRYTRGRKQARVDEVDTAMVQIVQVADFGGISVSTILRFQSSVDALTALGYHVQLSPTLPQTYQIDWQATALPPPL